jgi:hypothetical protein
MTEMILSALKTTPSVLVNGEFAILYRYQRWHLIRIRNGRLRMLHFMTEGQAQKMIESWYRDGILESAAQISEQFANDVDARVLETPQSYLAFLDADKVEIFGFDAGIQYPEVVADKRNNFLAKVSKMIETGRSGLYLCFADE